MLSTLTRQESSETANRRGYGRSQPRSIHCTQLGRVEEAMSPQKSSERTSRERSSVMAGQRIRPSEASYNDVGRTFSGKPEDAVEKEVEGEAIYHALRQLYVALQTRLESDLTVRERAELQRVARRELESLIERSVPDGPVVTLLGKIESGLDHWLTFVGEPAVSPMNNAAENALREPVVLRNLIGTLRNDRGVFVYETLLSLLATCRQQGRNPYEEFKQTARNNEIISRAQVVPAVASLG